MDHDESHPSYVDAPLSEDLIREHLLHRIVAGSALLFALCILPVAQYLLVAGQNNSKAETGTVAGVSTEAASTVQADVAEPTTEVKLSCVDQRTKDLADLDQFDTGKKQAIMRDYTAAIQPYKDAMAKLTDSADDQAQKKSISALIDDKYQPYYDQITAVERAVSEQRQQILATSCQ